MTSLDGQKIEYRTDTDGTLNVYAGEGQDKVLFANINKEAYIPLLENGKGDAAEKYQKQKEHSRKLTEHSQRLAFQRLIDYKAEKGTLTQEYVDKISKKYFNGESLYDMTTGWKNTDSGFSTYTYGSKINK